MRAARKIIVFSSLFFLIVAGLLASAAVYLYMHPDVVAERAGNYLADAAGIQVQAGRLEWSIRPLRIESRNVTLASPSGPNPFRVQISELTCSMHLEGRFGRRVLVIDEVRVGGVSVTIQAVDFEDSWKRFESDGVVRNVLARLAGFLFFRDISIREISVEGGAVDARFEGLDLNMAGLSAHHGPDGRVTMKGESAIHMRDIDGVVSAPDIRLTLEPGFSLPSMRVSADLEINDAELAVRQVKLAGIRGRFDLDADLAGKSITASKALISIGKFLEFDGRLEGRAAPRPTFEAHADRCVVQLSELPPFIAGGLPQVEADGSLLLSGRAGGTLVDGRWKLEGDAEAIVEGTAFSWETDSGDFSGEISGTADFSIDSSGFPAISSAALVLSTGTFSNDAVAVDFGDTEMRFSGRHPNYEVERFSARISRAAFAKAGDGLHFENIHVTGSGSGVDLENPSVDFPDVAISMPPAGNFSARGRISPEMSSISIAGENVGLIPLAVQHGLVPVNWEVSGRNRVRLEASLNSRGAIALDSGIELEGFSFEDPAGRFIGEGVSAGFDFEGGVDLDTGSISGELSARAVEGELLLDLFYLDLGRNPFKSRGVVEYVINERRARMPRYALGFEKLFDIVLEGAATLDSATSTRLSVHVGGTSLSPLYDLLVREPLGKQVPLLDDLRPEGMISADVHLSFTPRNVSVTGGVRLRDGLFSMVEKEIYGEDINIDFPVWLEIGVKEKADYADPGPPSGRFSVAGLRVPFLPEQHLDFKIEAAPNRIRIPGPTVIRIPGGRMEFGEIFSADFLREGVKAETSVKVISGDLSPLLSGIWPREKKGKLEGLLDPVVLEKNRISTGGGLRGDLFGGTVSVTGVEAERIFTSSPLIKFSLDFSDIDLGRLTGDTPFGRIDGILNGYIRNLELAGNQPQHFDMLLETAEQGRGNQKISIRAVENISRIGSGQSPFSGFAGVLTTFFETLGYKKIGVRATLNNDYFTVNGTIKENGSEYIMKRGGISGVNIVNRNPDNRIRFKDMVNRIKRVLKEDR